jgi:hypothetical protein
MTLVAMTKSGPITRAGHCMYKYSLVTHGQKPPNRLSKARAAAARIVPTKFPARLFPQLFHVHTEPLIVAGLSQAAFPTLFRRRK